MYAKSSNFWGLVNYYQRFVKDCAQLAKLLYCLTENNCEFQWTNQCQQAFDTLHRLLVSEVNVSSSSSGIFGMGSLSPIQM